MGDNGGRPLGSKAALCTALALRRPWPAKTLLYAAPPSIQPARPRNLSVKLSNRGPGHLTYYWLFHSDMEMFGCCRRSWKLLVGACSSRLHGPAGSAVLLLPDFARTSIFPAFRLANMKSKRYPWTGHPTRRCSVEIARPVCLRLGLLGCVVVEGYVTAGQRRGCEPFRALGGFPPGCRVAEH